MHRIAGIYAPANGEFCTPIFTVPPEPMWANADVSWHGQLNTTYDGIRGCDEGCAACEDLDTPFGPNPAPFDDEGTRG